MTQIPLTSISGYLDGLMDGIANTPEKGSGICPSSKQGQRIYLAW